MKRLPSNADVSGLDMTERHILRMCMSKYCINDMETCPCNSRKESTRYCEYHSRMVRIYAKICQPDLFTRIENVA